MQVFIHFFVIASRKTGVLTEWSLSRERILVANKPAAEKARSASTEVGGMLSYDLLAQLCLL